MAAAKTARSRNGARAQKAAPKLDATTRQRTARAQAKRLGAILEARLEFESMQIAGDMKDTDAVPGMPPKKNDDGTFMYEEGDQLVYTTFGEIYAENDAATARVERWIDQTGTRGLVEKLLDMERELEDASGE